MTASATATLLRAERAGAARATSTPSWAAVAAWGAALVEIALGAGALTTDAARGAGIVLFTLGAGGLGWGAATLARGRIVVPRAGVAGALGGIIAMAGTLALDPARISVLAVGAASALLLAVAFACALHLRAARGGGTDAGAPRLWAVVVAAFVVSALVTPALASTEAGQLAPDHGTHGIGDPGHH